MVESQFLERLDLLMRDAMSKPRSIPETTFYPGAGGNAEEEKNARPFGGKQVIFLGDFHQLPPVKPFQNCFQCGEFIPQNKEFVCISRDCKAQKVQTVFTDSDKWAFKAPVVNSSHIPGFSDSNMHRLRSHPRPESH